MAIDLKVDAPHMRTTQVIELPVGKSSLQALPPGKRTPEKEAEVAEKRGGWSRLVRELVAGRRGLVITYLAIEDDFKGFNHIEVAHHGAIEGIDRWGDVDVVVIIGRSLPLEDGAGAAGGRASPASRWSDRRRGAMVKQERTVGGAR